MHSASTPSDESSSSKLILLAGAIIVLVTVAAYFKSFSGAFVFDDQSGIIENSSIRHLSSLGAIMHPPVDAGVRGRPLANLTFALDYAVGGLDPRAYHATSLALHVFTALLLFGVIRRTLLLPTLRERFERDATWLALAAASLWAVHPLPTNVVTYLSQRTEGLMAFFYLLTLYSFVRSAEQPSRVWPVLTVLACALGMASKEVMVTAPVVVLLFDRTFVAGTFRGAWQQRRSLHLALAATWLLLACLMLGAQLAERGVGPALGVSPVDYALSECRAIFIYLRLVLWPSPLVFDYGWSFVHRVAEAAPYAAVVSALVVATFIALWCRPQLGFFGAWFFLILAPTSSIVPIVQQPIAENRVYLPLAAAATLVVIALYRNFGRRSLLASVVLAGVLSAATWQRQDDYRSAISLWSDTIAKRPNNARAHNNLGAAQLAAHLLPDAIAHFETARQLQPDYPEAHNNLGAALIEAGHAADAIAPLETALRLNPNFADAHYNLGEARFQTGAAADAVACFERSLALKPDQAKAHNNLGVALLQLGRVPEALAHDQAALRLDPAFAAAHYNFGNALAQAGRAPEAIAEFETALRLDPTFVKAHNNLGVLLLRAGKISEAVARFETALHLQPDYAEARRNLTLAQTPRSP